MDYKIVLAYRMKEYKILRNMSKDLEEKLTTIDIWFENFLMKNSRYIREDLVDCSYKITYNKKWLEYEEILKSSRLCKYYLELMYEQRN
jgi:hypothetical protein